MYKYIYKLKFNISILMALLIIIIFSIFSIKVLTNFYNFKKSMNRPNIELSMDIFKFLFKNELKKTWISLRVKEPLSDEESKLTTFHIFVKPSALKLLDSNLPESGKEQYIDGILKVSDAKKIKKIKLRYRGDSNFHWFFKQKSLRIKLKGDTLYHLSSQFNLLNPPADYSFRDVAYYDIAKKLGLISPSYYPVRVFINGQYMGVYMFLSQVDESLLRKYKRMPGSIYSGDNSPIKNNIYQLWFDSRYWEKKAARNAEQKMIREDIKNFISSLNNLNDEKFYWYIQDFFDIDKFITFIAIDRITGSYHHDFAHNHKIYFDPYKGKFEPIEWDVRYLQPEKLRKDIGIYLLQLRFALNPILDNKIDKYIYNLINKKNIFSKIKSKYLAEVDNAYMDLSADAFRDTNIWASKLFKTTLTYSVPFTMKDFDQVISSDMNKIDSLKSIFKDRYEKVSIVYKTIKENNQTKILFKINGNNAIVLNFNNKIKNYIKKDFDGKLISINAKEVLYPGRCYKERFSFPTFGTKEITNCPEYYTFIIKKDLNEVLENIKIRNFISGKIVNLVSENFIKKDLPDSIHPWKLIEPEHKLQVLRGDIYVNKSLVFDRYTTVSIKPGTKFIMDANTSIFFYGKVMALGTKKKPIKFMAKDLLKPWGLVAIQGKGATGSKFEYVEFENGSIDTHNLIHYTSPFNIHDMDWFEVRHCKIGRNFVGDDSMHIAYAKGIVDSCEFKDAKSDGLDIDISDVNITNNIFYNSGNDGLDIMTTTMNASNNVFIDMGDKGISVGEWSEANITDSFFLRTLIGTEIKDKSRVVANNLVYVDSIKKAINLYNKNKRYDTGGFLIADNIYLLGNTKVTVDKRSKQKIKDGIENNLPNLKKFKWYKNLNKTRYIEFIKEIRAKYAK